MNYLYSFFLLLLCSIITQTSMAQVTNENRYNIEVRSTGYYWNYDDEVGIDEPTFLLDGAVDANGQYTCLINTDGTGYKTSAYWDADTGPNGMSTYTHSSRYRTLVSRTNQTTTYTDITYFAMEWDCGARLTYESCDDTWVRWCMYRNAKVSGYGPGEWYRSWTYDNVEGQTGIRLDRTWRYYNGQGQGRPLEFGTLANGTTSKSHFNYNRRAASGASQSMGYTSEWTSGAHPSFSGAADVTYRFTVNDISRIVLSTNYSSTNYNTKIHLVKDLPGSEWELIATNDDLSASNNKSYLDVLVESGSYFVVVEGASSSDHGAFLLSLVKYNASMTPGTIAHPGDWIKEGCSINYDISNITSGTLSHGTPGYAWEMRETGTSNWTTIAGATNDHLTNAELGPINEDIEVRRVFSSSLGLSQYSNVLFFENLSPGESGTNGRISGKITGKNGNGEIANVEVFAVADPPVPGACPDEVYSAISIGNGEYVIPNMFYGKDTSSWKIYPVFLDHEFDPDTFFLDLYPAVHERQNIDFMDTTTIFINGRITQSDPNSINDTTCGIPDVGFYLNNQNQIPKTTNNSGHYQLAISNRDPNNRYVIRPDTMNYQFTPNQTPTLEILQDTSGVDFVNSRMDTIRGSVQACGNFCFGAVDVRIIDMQSCFEYVERTTACGIFEIVVPARAYEIYVVGVDVPSLKPGYTSGAILEYFSTIRDTVDITREPAQVSFIYRQAPVISISGLSATCQDTVLEQGVEVPLTIYVTEMNTDGCPLDTGVLIINDGISDRDVIELPISNGEVSYTILPGQANIFAPYKKNFNITARDIEDPDLIANVNFNVIVAGNKPRQATFTTVSPEIPMLILRDPPGDNSYSFVEESNTTEMAVKFSALIGGGVSLWREVKAGAQFEAGFLGFSTESEAWATVNDDLSVAAYNSTTNEHIWSITNGIRYETEQSDELMGKDADIFVAGALNLRYALTDIISYNSETCSVEESIDIIMGADSINTLAVYTRNNILTNIIPDLEVIRDLQTDPDSAGYYNVQIEAWQQMLDRNEELKNDALPDPSIPNLSWDGGDGAFTKWTTKSSSQTTFMEFQIEIERSIAVEAGFEVAGSGVSGGAMAFFRMEVGGSSTIGNLQERTHGFVLDDNDPEDTYETEIFFDPVYSTPVFKNTSAKTSCPYDGGTLIDNPILGVDNPTAVNIPPDGFAHFNFSITNGTELNGNSSNSTRTYYLDVVNGSNPHSANIDPGGDGIFPVIFTDMVKGETRNRLVRVSRTDPSIFSFEGLKFILYPECDGDESNVSTTLDVSAFFTSTCSDITLNAPEANWLVNESSVNNLSVHMTDYNKDLITDVIIQYTPSGLNSWTSAEIVPVSALNNNATAGTFVDLDVSSIPDGSWDLRLRLNCNNGTIYTPRVAGKIDRTKAMVLGLPNPIDDDYNLSENDEISVYFTEAISCENANAVLMDMETNDIFTATITCGIDKVEVVPDQILGNLDPAAYRVVLSGISDVAGNISDTYRWAFIVGDYVYDPDCSPVMISNNNVNQDAISQNVYYSEFITSNGTVNPASSIEFIAEQGIDITEGFEVSDGGTFEADIATCPND